LLGSILKQKGYRETDNREFLRAPVSEIIHIISKMPGQITDSSNFMHELPNDGLISHHQEDELDALILDEPDSYPWSSTWETAENYYYGYDDTIQDYNEAMRLYREAAKLGCLMAFLRIGRMYQNGEGVPESSQKALEYYKEGARKGNYYCYLEMGELFRLKKHQDNFVKCMRLFFKGRNDHINAQIENIMGFHRAWEQHIMSCFISGTYPLPEVVKEMAVLKTEIIDSMRSTLNYYKRQPNSAFVDSMIKSYQEAITWANENL
jgi:hypothetical protein